MNPDLELDLAPFIARDPLGAIRLKLVETFGEAGPSRVGGRLVATPEDLAIVEQLRADIRDRVSLSAGEPTDVFLYFGGRPARRDVTLMGGLPYRPKGLAWPTGGDGTPLTFVAQLRFTESVDLVGTMPGDLLLLFIKDLDIASDDEPSPVYVEWQSHTDRELVSDDDLPTPSFDVPELHALRYRTVDYPEESDDDAIWSVVGDDGEWWSTSRIEGTKIGGAPMWIHSPSDRVEGRFLCTFGSVCFEDDSAEGFSWVDAGALYFFQATDGILRWDIQYY